MKLFARNFFAAALIVCVALGALAPPAAQAGALSDYLENKLVDEQLRGQAYSPPASSYIALLTTACSDAAAGTEVSGGSYARAAIANSLANWSGTQAAGSTAASSGTGGTTSNNVAINFAAPTASWGTVSHIGFFNAATGGNLLICTALSTPKTISAGDTVSFPPGSLTVQIDN